ncbi:hypothetical protein LP419_35935 [Massilia sp. H-1]|nr:hypothetical protein LP419_35935 [Massilia sp. H-1]
MALKADDGRIIMVELRWMLREAALLREDAANPDGPSCYSASALVNSARHHNQGQTSILKQFQN